MHRQECTDTQTTHATGQSQTDPAERRSKHTVANQLRLKQKQLKQKQLKNEIREFKSLFSTFSKRTKI